MFRLKLLALWLFIGLKILFEPSLIKPPINFRHAPTR